MRKSKGDVDEAVVLEWIEFEVESKMMDGIIYEDGVPVAKMRDKKPDEKDRLREHLMEKHGAAHLDYHSIYEWKFDDGAEPAIDRIPRPSLPEEQLSGNTMSLGDVLKGMTTTGEEV